jgi:hypothetical protein
MPYYLVMKDLEKRIFNTAYLAHWESQYQKLAAVQAQPYNPPLSLEFEKELNQWAAIQRRMKHVLPACLKNKLAAINFDFNDPGPCWDQLFSQLETFGQVHGHTFLPDNDPAYENLRDWLIRQVQHHQYLSEDRRQKLDALGVDWNMTASGGLRWQNMFLNLKTFFQQHGHSRVPQQWASDPQLAYWVLVQRRVYARHKMPPARARLLRSLDFVWHIQTLYHAQWDSFYQQLVVFRQEHGHCQVPGRYKQLVSWIERQRLVKSKNLLSPEREKKLSGLDFIWTFEDIRQKYWQQMYRQLRQYKIQHGHCLVPVLDKENRSLGTWVAAQRRLEARQKLAKTRRQQLDRLGFTWRQQLPTQLKAHYDGQWQACYQKLVAYQQKNSSCQVSLKVDPQLQRWTCWQRRLFLEGKLKAQRQQQLDAIHFPWSIAEGYWLKMYQALADFKHQHGHTRVTSGKGQNNKLAVWAYRQGKNKAHLLPRQVDLLNTLGFDWHLPSRTVVPWQAMYNRLVAFKQAFGHSLVPVTWCQDPKLGKWASRMRQEKDCLPPKSRALLEALDFEWTKRCFRKTA